MVIYSHAAITKRKTKLHLQVTNSDQATAHGGQVLIDALCRRFGLWKRIHEEPSLDVRKRTGAGFSPVANVAQLLFTLTSGGASLADAERMGKDRVLMDLLGLEQGRRPNHPGRMAARPDPGKRPGAAPDQRRVCGLVQPAGQTGALAAWRRSGDLLRRHRNGSGGTQV